MTPAIKYPTLEVKSTSLSVNQKIDKDWLLPEQWKTKFFRRICGDVRAKIETDQKGCFKISSRIQNSTMVAEYIISDNVEMISATIKMNGLSMANVSISFYQRIREYAKGRLTEDLLVRLHTKDSTAKFINDLVAEEKQKNKQNLDRLFGKSTKY